MKLLVLAPDYPKDLKRGYHFGGVFNERSVAALQGLCESVEVLVPRPYAPPLLSSFMPRWQIHRSAVAYELRNAVPVYRPNYVQIPRVSQAFCHDLGSYLFCRRTARRMHNQTQFDAILSFDLAGTGGLAWRMGKNLRIPACGWATGDDVRVPASSSYGRVVGRALERLDLIFYQSQELLEMAASLWRISPSMMSVDRHVILPRGIQAPPSLCRIKFRNRLRKELGVTDEQVLVLSVGRITREKGVFNLIEAVSLATTRDSRITCVLVGSSPAFDETSAVHETLIETRLEKRVKLLPACDPNKVWEYLCAADIFAFTSHHEGMPNSLLEAMAMKVPSIAFAIPPVLEIEAGTGGLELVPPLDPVLFSEAIVRLAASPDDRVRIGETGRIQVMDRFMMRKNMAIALQQLSKIANKASS